MANRKKNTIRKSKRKIHKKRKRNFVFRKWFLLLILCIALVGTGWYVKNTIVFYYAKYFNKFQHNTLKNNVVETARIDRIIENYHDKIFGMDISHYQNPKDIQWDSLSIANRSIPLKFVVIRATMGKNGKDKQFQYYWETAKKYKLTRGAYHFYRADEDPILQANNFLESVKLESDDLLPVLDIEKNPRKISREELRNNLKIWLKIVEEKYGKKPILYTYYHYYRDYLEDDFGDYPLWLANYNNVLEPSLEHRWKMWQFTENGIVYGINTKVDLNVFNGNSWEFNRLLLD